MSTSTKLTFGIVIKTSEYTGNFEREMCAFLTGIIGECNVGNDMTNLLTEGRPDFEHNINQVTDEDGCYRPVSLDENDANNLIIFFHSKPTEEQIKWIKDNAAKYDEVRKTHGHMAQYYKDEKKIEILGFELEECIQSTTPRRVEL